MIKSLGGAQQGAIPFTPTIMPTTVGDWTVTYTTQTGLMVVQGALAYVEVSLVFTPTFTAAATGALRIGTLPVPAVSGLGALQTQSTSANITWPSNATQLTPRPSGDMITIFGSKSIGSGVSLQPSGLVSGAAHTLSLAGWIRVA